MQSPHVTHQFSHIQTLKAETAEKTFSISQMVIILLLAGFTLGASFVWGMAVARIILAVISAIYTAVVIIKLSMGLYSIASCSQQSQEECELLPDGQLPTITVLAPLYREAKVVGRLVQKLAALNWPSNRLEVLLLIREHDTETREALESTELPHTFRIVTIEPKDYGTKPAALNVGLDIACGEFFIIYDAENGPVPDQLRKAYAKFLVGNEDLVAVQAIPVVSNWQTKRFWQKILPKFQAAEYAGHYGLLNPALFRKGLVAPLPGNSVLFRTEAVRAVGKYDRYNKAEDCDMAIRLARRDWKVDFVWSETTEEAPTKFGEWMRQRRRWTDGFMQTYLVHMRRPLQLVKELGVVNFIVFQLIVGGTPFILLFNPVLWTLTTVYWATQSTLIQSLFPWPILYLAVTTTLVGNFAMFYSLLIGIEQRRMYSISLLMFVVPFYWLVMSVAAYRAVFDLVFKVGWHKTDHHDEENEHPQEVALSAQVSR